MCLISARTDDDDAYPPTRGATRVVREVHHERAPIPVARTSRTIYETRAPSPRRSYAGSYAGSMYGGSTTSVARYPAVVAPSPRASYVSERRRIEAQPMTVAEPVIVVPVASNAGRSRRSSRVYY